LNRPLLVFVLALLPLLGVTACSGAFGDPCQVGKPCGEEWHPPGNDSYASAVDGDAGALHLDDASVDAAEDDDAGAIDGGADADGGVP
jgi:hypothetical protein